MSLWPDTAAKMLNEQYDIYEKAREEYRNKIAKQAARIQQLEAALREIAKYKIEDGCPCNACQHSAIARAALGEKP